MHQKKKPWHRLVMVCPQCGEAFQPEVYGLHVRLCPLCEAERSGLQKDMVCNFERMPVKEDCGLQADLGRG